MALTQPPGPVVCSYNEWDPLEEVIVGRLDGQAEMSWEIPLYGFIPESDRAYNRERAFALGGRARAAPQEAVDELDEFVRVLVAEGVTVRRPDLVDNTRSYTTPDWTSPGGLAQTCPRDVMLVVGNEIIEAPMSWRSRYFEFRAYRRLVKEYFSLGAKWTAAPKGQLSNELYENFHGKPPTSGTFVTTEFEPVFDAADVVRCGKDLFAQRSHVTNESGIEWLSRHLAPTYNVHRVEFDDHRAVHIDATWMPLAPGKVLINTDRPIKNLPACFEKSGWDFLTPPRTTWPASDPYQWQYQWLLLNVLMLDEERVIVEKHEEPLILAMRDWGFKPIPVPFRNCFRFGGGFHCFTCDIRRRGTLRSYF